MALVKSIKNEVIRILTLRAFDWYMYWSYLQRGSLGWVRIFGGWVSKYFLGHFKEILHMSSESSARALSIGTLFVQIRGKGAVCMPTSQSHARMGVCRRVCEAKAPNHCKLAG